MSANKKIVSRFVRKHPGRHSVGSMGRSSSSHESRYAKASSSHQDFSQKAKTEPLETVTIYKGKKHTQLNVEEMPEEYRRMQTAMEKLRYLRLAYDQVAKMELETEVRRLYEKQVLKIVAEILILYRGDALPPSSSNNNAIYLRDMTFDVQKLTSTFEEHFLCVLVYRMDVKFTRLATLSTDHVTFPESFRYDIPDQKFTIELRLYSILDKERSWFTKTKRFFKKLLGNTQGVTRGFRYHGRMLVTNKHRKRDEPMVFESQDPASRVGVTGVRLFFTNREKKTDNVDCTVENRQMA